MQQCGVLVCVSIAPPARQTTHSHAQHHASQIDTKMKQNRKKINLSGLDQTRERSSGEDFIRQDPRQTFSG